MVTHAPLPPRPPRRRYGPPLLSSLPGNRFMALEFKLNASAPTGFDCDCVVVGLFADGGLTDAAKAIDAASGGRLGTLVSRGDASGKSGKTALLHDVPGVTAPRVLVVGLGEQAKFSVPQYLKAVGDAARALKAGPVAHALLTLPAVTVDGRDAAWAIRQAAIAADHACYRYTATLGEKSRKKDEPGLRTLTLQGEDAEALAQGQAIAAGVQFARELAHLPPNVCNPSYLAAQAQEFCGRFDTTSCEVLDVAEMEKLGMGALLAVGRGSANAPRLIAM